MNELDYADRREAFFQLRGALDAYDRSEPCEPSSCDERIVREARELAWWPHGNPSDRTIFQARKAAFTRLRDAIAAGDIPP